MIGVDYDLFWTLNPKSLSPFVKAFQFKREYDNMVCWQQGLYIQKAIASVFGKNEKYPSKPFDGKENKPMTSEEIKQRVMQQAKMINSRFGKEGVIIES